VARQAELSARGARPVVVSFGAASGAGRWLQETRCPWPMLLDEGRDLYKRLGLGISVSRVWSVSCLVYYAEQVKAGRELPRPFENVEDDPHQMGGDFILDRAGVLRLSYCSQAANDRPELETLLAAMDGESSP